MAEPQGGLVQTSAQKQTGICYWNAFTAKGNPDILELEVDLYRSAAKAQQAYDSVAQSVADGWAPQGVTASAWSVPGLGDQAIGQVQTGVPQTGEATAALPNHCSLAGRPCSLLSCPISRTVSSATYESRFLPAFTACRVASEKYLRYYV